MAAEPSRWKVVVDSVARNPIGNGPARHFNAVFGRDAEHGLSLRMTEVVQTEHSGDDARRI